MDEESKGQIAITFECLNCGGTVLELPDDYTDDSIAKCKSCGTEFGRFGDVKAKSIEAAFDSITTSFGDILK